MNPDINLDEYQLEIETHDDIVELLNIYLCYYKKLYKTNPNNHMFENINFDHDDSTNRCLENLYSEIQKFKNSTNPNSNILFEPSDIDIKNHKELYALYIDEKIIYIALYLLPLLKYISTIEWQTKNWNIIPIR